MPNASGRGRATRHPTPGWVECSAKSDLGKQLDVEIIRGLGDDLGDSSWEVDDPTIAVGIVGDRILFELPLTQLDVFVEGLQAALLTARRHRIIPATLSEDERVRRVRVAAELAERRRLAQGDR